MFDGAKIQLRCAVLGHTLLEDLNYDGKFLYMLSTEMLLCRDFICQLYGSLFDDASPKIGVLKFGYGNVVLILLVEFHSSLVIDALAITVDNLLPIPFICILLQELFCEWYITIV